MLSAGGSVQKLAEFPLAHGQIPQTLLAHLLPFSLHGFPLLISPGRKGEEREMTVMMRVHLLLLCPLVVPPLLIAASIQTIFRIGTILIESANATLTVSSIAPLADASSAARFFVHGPRIRAHIMTNKSAFSTRTL